MLTSAVARRWRPGAHTRCRARAGVRARASATHRIAIGAGGADGGTSDASKTERPCGGARHAGRSAGDGCNRVSQNSKPHLRQSITLTSAVA